MHKKLQNYRIRLNEAREDWIKHQKDLASKYNDPAALFLSWRTRNIDLYDYEVAEALNKSIGYVYNYTQANLFKRYRPKPGKFDKMVSELCLQHCEDESWLNGVLTSYGFRDTKEATGKDEKDLISAIESFGNSEINPIDLQIYHQIYNMHIVQGRTTTEIADILGLSRNYISNCMAKYRIPSNTSSIAAHSPQTLRLYRQIKYYCPNIVRLKKQGIILLGPGNISVRLSEDIKKPSSTQFKIEATNDHYKWLPIIVPDYEDPEISYPHWTIKTKISNSIEKRVAALRLTSYSLESFDKWPEHPIEELERCWKEVTESNNIRTDDVWKLIEHYFGNEELRYYAERPHQMFHILTDATKNDKTNHKIITSRSLTEYLYKKRLRIGYMRPDNIARALIEMRTIGPIYDPFPGIGCLAIACARLKIPYMYGNQDHIWNRAVDNGFAERLEEFVQPYDGSEINYLMSQNLPQKWYPLYGQKARLWSAVNSGNTYHLKLMMETYDLVKECKVGNTLRMINFHPVRN